MHEIKTIPIGQLQPAPYNPRVDLKPGDADYEKLRRSMDEFGCVELIVWNKRSGYVISGHQRLKVLQATDAAEVECVVVDLDDDQERALNVAMNKISGAWDEDKLRELLGQLSADFDATLTGFDTEEMQALLDMTRAAEQDDFDVDAALEEIEAPVTRRGDVWQLGRHRLMCGDATNADDVAMLMGGQQAKQYFTDPPYGADYHAQAGSIMNDNLSGLAFYDLLKDAFECAAGVCEPGAVAYIFHSDTKGAIFRQAFKCAGWELHQVLVWVKNQFVLGRNDYQNRYEPILYGWLPGAGHYFCGDRTQSTVIFEGEPPDPQKLKKDDLIALLVRYMERDSQVPQDVLYADKPLRSAEHPTMKPVPLLGQLIKNSSRPGDIVLDTFGGSGSTLIACEELERTAFLMELDPKYCDVIIQRWQAKTGQTATKRSAL